MGGGAPEIRRTLASSPARAPGTRRARRERGHRTCPRHRSPGAPRACGKRRQICCRIHTVQATGRVASLSKYDLCRSCRISGCHCRASVVIYWYEATFEGFNAGVALGLVRKDLHQAGFFSCPPPSHPQIGASSACFRKVRGGPYPSTIRVDMNAKDPDRRYAIEFYGMTGAEPTK